MCQVGLEAHLSCPGKATPDGPDRHNIQINYNPTVRLGDFRRSGTLKQWKKHIGKICVHSSRARLAVASVFAAPLLRLSMLNSFGINFSGVTSGGKSLLVRLGCSAAGLISDEGPTTWDGSAPAFEQRALGHRDCAMSLDDISHLEGDANHVAKIATLVTFRLAANRPKAKAAEYVAAHNLVESDFRVIPLSTSEDPLWDTIKDDNSGPRRVRGEEVRMINVRAYVSDVGDIFDGPRARDAIGACLNDRLRVVEKLEELTARYQGAAFRTYLTKLVANKSAAKNMAKSYLDEFCKVAPLPAELRWLGRIRRLCGILYAGAALAIDYNVLPWSKSLTQEAIKVCMNDAMDQLISYAGEPMHEVGPASHAVDPGSDDALLQKFAEHVSSATFVHLKARRTSDSLAARLKHADGIIRPTSKRKCRCLLFSKTLRLWFPNANARGELVKALRSRGVFGKGRRGDTSTQQTYLAEFAGKVPCYVLRRKRLKALSTHCRENKT
jgi:hypothetical protein